MASNQKLLFTVFHGAAFLTYVYVIYFYHFIKTPRKDREFAGPYKYLTFWNLWLQCFIYGSSFFLDIVQKNSLKKKVRNIRDYVFHSLAWPVGLFVFLMFWSLFLYDRELILPKALQPYYPTWLNHISHTLILPCLIIESASCYHRPPRRNTVVSTLSVFALIYGIWVLWLGMAKSIWVYPVLEVLGWTWRIMFMVFSAISFSITYALGSTVDHKIRSMTSQKISGHFD